MRTVQRLASLMRRCARHEGLPTMGTGAAALACGLAHSRACQVTDAGLSGPSTYLGCTTSSLDLPSMGIGCAESALSRSFATTVTFHAKDGKSGDEGSHANSSSASDASADAPDAAPGSSVLDEGFALADFDAETEAFTRQASGDGEYEHVQSMLRELREQQLGEEESRQALESSSAGADDLHDDAIKHADQMTKTQAKFYVNQLVAGRLDSQLPPLGSGSPVQQRHTRELDQFMKRFKMQVVDVNRSNKGTRSGGIGRFSTMVVVGNFQGVLGLGVGKAAELSESVQKAYAQALKTLFYVPRFRGHTILQPLKAKYGRVLLYAWPKSSHGGVVANNLMSSICRLAGITNIGIKLHGSRCTRNAVKALFNAFESQSTLSEMQRSLGNYRVRELAVGADRRIRKQRKRVQSAPGEWYHELPEESKPHSLPQCDIGEMPPGDAQALLEAFESQSRPRAFAGDRRGSGYSRGRPAQRR